MTARRWVVLACLFSIGSARTAANQEAASKTDAPKIVSIIKLMIKPEVYDKATIRVIGFLALDREYGGALYLHRADFENEILEHSVRFDLRDAEVLRKYQALDRRYVFVEGVFRANEKDSTEMTAGRLTPVKIILRWPLNYNIHGETPR